MKAASSTVAVALLVLSNGCTGEVMPLPVGITPGTTGGAGGDNNVASGGTAGAGGAPPSSPDSASPSGTPSGTGRAPTTPPDRSPGRGCLGGAGPPGTSGTMGTRGPSGSGLRQPGGACNACHSRGEGPRFAFGGTVYPSGHEPSQCNGGGPGGAQVVVADATGRSITAPVNAAG